MKNFFNKLTFLLTLSLSLVLTSCNTAGGGALTGAMFGGIIGSSIGGIGGGYRGSNVGTLVGMAVGAGTGAAIGAAAESQERERVREHYRNLHIDRDYDDIEYDDLRKGKIEMDDVKVGHNDDDDYDFSASKAERKHKNSGYSKEPVYNDVIELEPSKDTAPNQSQSVSVSDLKGANEAAVAPPAAVVEVSETGAKVTTPIVISNARFINNDNTTHIAKGELVKVSFEVRNASDKNLYGIVPTVTETTGNKHLLISPSTLIENLGSHKAIRYTAYISAEQSLKKGTAHFQICVMSAGKQLSNVIEFDVELN